MSGAGKSTALRAVEDIGYFCVDNMPPRLLGTFYDLCEQSTDARMKKCAVVIDVRSVSAMTNLYDEIKANSHHGRKFKVLFLDAKTETLITRYKETRRSHPLADFVPDRSVEKAVKKEKELMGILKAHSDYVIDTTYMSLKQLRERVTGLFSTSITDSMKVTVMSFGFKYGIPLEADIVFDARCLINPYYVPELKQLTGLDKEVRDYVMASEDSVTFLEKIPSETVGNKIDNPLNSNIKNIVLCKNLSDNVCLKCSDCLSFNVEGCIEKTCKDYGYVVYNCNKGDLKDLGYNRSNIPCGKDLLKLKGVEVYSLNNITDTEKMSVCYNNGLKANTMNTDYIFAFWYIDETGNMVMEKSYYANSYELALQEIETKAKDNDVLKAYVELYNALDELCK